jgi:hypothetical protein
MCGVGIIFWGLGAFIKGRGAVLAVSRDCPVTVTLPLALTALALCRLFALLGCGAVARFHRFEGKDNALNGRADVGELFGERG